MLAGFTLASFSVSSGAYGWTSGSYLTLTPTQLYVMVDGAMQVRGGGEIRVPYFRVPCSTQELGLVFRLGLG